MIMIINKFLFSSKNVVFQSLTAIMRWRFGDLTSRLKEPLLCGREGQRSPTTDVRIIMCLYLTVKHLSWFFFLNPPWFLPDVFLCVQHLHCPCVPLHCPRAASKQWPTAPPPYGCAGRNRASATCASSTIRCAAARREPPTPLWSLTTPGQKAANMFRYDFWCVWL